MSATQALKSVATGKPAAHAVNRDTFSNWITGPGVQAKIMSMMRGSKGSQFTTSLVAAVTLNPALGKCERGSILSAALQGAALDLSPSPSTGHFYMVPYGNSVQFQLGYRGMIQLAMRSGKYRHLNACEIREGELKGWNPLTEELSIEIEESDSIRESLPVIGFVARFELLNGFTKTVYWSKKRIESHARRYSKTFNSKSSPWQSNFNEMAIKTTLRDLIGHWGPMSIEMEQCYHADTGVITPDGNIEYIDAGDAEDEALKEKEVEKSPPPTASPNDDDLLDPPAAPLPPF